MFQDGEQAQLKNLEGTYHFVAPECTTGETYDVFIADVWALGVTLYCFVYGVLPFFSADGGVNGLLEKIKEADPAYPETASAEAIDLLKGLMAKDPEARLTMDAVVAHPWMKGVEVKHMEAREKIEVSEEEVNNAITINMSVLGLVTLQSKLKKRLVSIYIYIALHTYM